MRFKLNLWTILLWLVPAFLLGQEIQVQWEPREDLNILLPPSIEVFESNGQLEDGARYRAVYARVDLTDPNLNLRATGSNTHRETTQKTAARTNSILALNGGYFSSDRSVSLLIADGELISPGTHYTRPRGAFGMHNGEPLVFWSHASGWEEKPKFLFTPSLQAKESRINPNLAVGAGPVLIKEGALYVTSSEEGFGGSHTIRHPRSAIGYQDKNTLIWMVVDGRQPTSAGVTLPELATLMMSAGAVEAVNLDGGGSSAMIAAGEVVNIPADIVGGNRNSLRKNASALILSERTPSEKPDIYTIDTDSPFYREIGWWKETNLLNHYGSTPSRQASTNQGLNKAIYSFEEIPLKIYQLAAWWPVDPQNSPGVRYVVHHSQGRDTLDFDQTDLSRAGRWNILGNYPLGTGDSLEVLGGADQGKIQADAVRLVASHPSPELPVRGDTRIAVISDLNSGLGAADYQWQVDSIIQRIPRIWKPDLVISGGDMVAGMGISDTAHLRRMWQGFEKHVAGPLRKAAIPFAFTLGNHDGPRSYPVERRVAQEFWNRPEADPGIEFVDREFFPNYYSFVLDDIFFVSWEASSSKITEENLDWMEKQFNRPEARAAKYRFLMGHMPLYSVAQERDSRGNVLDDPERLQQLLEQYQVHTYISGHQHAFYPGKRGNLHLLNTGAAGSGPRAWLTMDLAPTNTITIMDVFYEQDSIAYTTYEIKERDAQNMKILDSSILPSAMLGVNGHQIRQDIDLSESFSGVFAPVRRLPQREAAIGTVDALLDAGQLKISATLDGLSKRAIRQGNFTLFVGRNTEDGELLMDLSNHLKIRKGRFGLALDASELSSRLQSLLGPGEDTDSSNTPPMGYGDLQELLSVGALHLKGQIKNEVVRAQLLPLSNRRPIAPEITSHHDRNTYAVRDLEAMYDISWDASPDSDGDFVAYVYQVARDQGFKDLLVDEYMGRNTSFKKTERFWFQLLEDATLGEPVSLYHRVLASDGRNISYSPHQRLRLFKSEEPLDDLIEVPAPHYEFKGQVAPSGAGYGAEWDGHGKLWLADYRGSLIIKNPDGSDAPFSPLTAVNIEGETYNLNPINGIGTDLDGNILVGRNRNLIKIDAKTGEGIAVWQVPQGNRAITSPRVNDKGEIYAASLFGEDPLYVLRPDPENPAGFELLRTLNLEGRNLSRTFDMSQDGMRLYFPDPGRPLIQVFSSADKGTTYSFQENITSTSSGSSAIQIMPNGSLFAAVRSSGIKPSTIHFRDEQNQRMWTLELPEVNGAEPRGIGVSPDGSTIIFCSWDQGGGYYLFERVPEP